MRRRGRRPRLAPPCRKPVALPRLLTGDHVNRSTTSLLFLAALSVVGDLFESLVKRSAGAKDSSGLLPGHGGVLDRIDALLPVFPAALALASWQGG